MAAERTGMVDRDAVFEVITQRLGAQYDDEQVLVEDIRELGHDLLALADEHEVPEERG